MLTVRAAGRWWDHCLALAWGTANRTRHEKLLDTAQEIAGHDRSRDEKLTNLQMML